MTFFANKKIQVRFHSRRSVGSGALIHRPIKEVITQIKGETCSYSSSMCVLPFARNGPAFTFKI